MNDIGGDTPLWVAPRCYIILPWPVQCSATVAVPRSPQTGGGVAELIDIGGDTPLWVAPAAIILPWPVQCSDTVVRRCQ